MRSETPRSARYLLAAAGLSLGVFALDVVAARLPVGIWSGLAIAVATAALTIGVSTVIGSGIARREAASAAAGIAMMTAAYYLAVAVAAAVRHERLISFYVFWPLIHTLALGGLLLTVARMGRPPWRATLPVAASTLVLMSEAIARLSDAGDAGPATTGYVWLAGLAVGSVVGAGLSIGRLYSGGPPRGADRGEVAA